MLYECVSGLVKGACSVKVFVSKSKKLQKKLHKYDSVPVHSCLTYCQFGSTLYERLERQVYTSVDLLFKSSSGGLLLGHFQNVLHCIWWDYLQTYSSTCDFA